MDRGLRVASGLVVADCGCNRRVLRGQLRLYVPLGPISTDSARSQKYLRRSQPVATSAGMATIFAGRGTCNRGHALNAPTCRPGVEAKKQCSPHAELMVFVDAVLNDNQNGIITSANISISFADKHDVYNSIAIERRDWHFVSSGDRHPGFGFSEHWEVVERRQNRIVKFAPIAPFQRLLQLRAELRQTFRTPRVHNPKFQGD